MGDPHDYSVELGERGKGKENGTALVILYNVRREGEDVRMVLKNGGWEGRGKGEPWKGSNRPK
jgi:hypothetical protein